MSLTLDEICRFSKLGAEIELLEWVLEESE